jgi:hypothetical protein
MIFFFIEMKENDSVSIVIERNSWERGSAREK